MTPSDAKVAIDAAYGAADQMLLNADLLATSGFDTEPFIVDLKLDPDDILPTAVSMLKSRCGEIELGMFSVVSCGQLFEKATQEIGDLLLYSFPAIGLFNVEGFKPSRFAIGTLPELRMQLRTWFWDHQQYVDKVAAKLADLKGSETLLADQDASSLSLGIEPPECPITDELFRAIKQRLFLERGQLYRDHVGKELLTLLSEQGDDAEPMELTDSLKTPPSNKWTEYNLEEVEKLTPDLPDKPDESAEWLAFRKENYHLFPHSAAVMRKDRERKSHARINDEGTFGITVRGYRWRSKRRGTKTYFYKPDFDTSAE